VLPNGLTLVAEALPNVRSVAFALAVPAGAVTEPEDRAGLSAVLYGLAQRGAGERDTRALSDALDGLGVIRSGGADREFTSFSGALLADDLDAALGLYADIVRRPRLPEAEFPAEQALALQALATLEDQPQSKFYEELIRAYFPGPHGRSALGTEAGLSGLTVADAQADHARRYRPRGAILAVAGRFDWARLCDLVAHLFGDWEGAAPALPTPDPTGRPAYRHIAHDAEQVQVGFAYPDVTLQDPGYYDSRMAVMVLSGGMGARFFVEVREKRGLVYGVRALPGAVKGQAYVLCHASATPANSQEAYDVMRAEVEKLPQGVTPEEVQRARTGLLSTLIMQGESTSARASAIARDQYYLGRVRTLEEIRAAVESVTPESIQAHLQAHPPRDFTSLSLGPAELKVE
jgi:predicted Zn-dependent peptidase